MSSEHWRWQTIFQCRRLAEAKRSRLGRYYSPADLNDLLFGSSSNMDDSETFKALQML